MSGYFKRLRVQWIVTTIRERGHLNRADICTEFEVSVPQASVDLRDAQQADPVITYDRSAKRYVYRPEMG